MELNHNQWMSHALELAKQAEVHDEVPVGAVVVKAGQIVGKGFNQPIGTNDPTAHAEIMALRDAAKNLNNYRLPDCTLYVTIEPCSMCAGALIHSRIKHVVFGAREPRAGALCSHLQLFDSEHFNHQISITEGVLTDECSGIIKSFFAKKRI